MKLAMKKEVEVEAKTLSIYTKCSDRFCASIKDQNGETLFDQDDGYVWGIMPDDHYGDYIILDIDIDTGQITNWQTPSSEEVQNIINGEEE